MKNLTCLAVMATILVSTAVPAAAVNACYAERVCDEILSIEFYCKTVTVCTS